ncbi:MAG: hypothetical protein R2861_15735 [Desulfobacterales bacterium]
MNILLLQGGAKKNGNTAKVLGWVKGERPGLYDVENRLPSFKKKP